MGVEYEAVCRGIQAMVAKFHTRRAEVDAVLRVYDAHASSFLEHHPWADLKPEEFCEAVIQKL